MKQRILFAALALLLLSACHKENLDPRMEIFIEKMQGNGKLTLDGTTSTWNDGDTLRLNGTPVVVERHDGHAYISNTAALSTNRALFPTRLVTGGPTTDNITVTLPREYDYRSDGSHQLLDLPLAARATDGEPLHFQHLTGALCFMLTNSTSHPLTIDRITVSSNRYQLSGERNINLASIGSIGPATDSTDADRTVNMTFTRQSLEIPASGSANVVLPIAPVDSGNIFTVTVVSHYQGSRYTYTKTQGESKTDRSLARNEIGYAAISLSGMAAEPLFPLGDGTRYNPYQIATPTDFILMVDAISNGRRYNNQPYSNKHYRITANLNLNGISIYPIRNYNNATFDGNNKTIDNLTINSREDTCALFSNPTSVTLKNISLNNLTLKHNGNASTLYLGGFCGYIQHDSLRNCDITGLNLSINGTFNELYFGGLASYISQNNVLENCNFTNTAPISLDATALFYGNLLGRCANSSLSRDLKLTSCTANTSTVTLTSSSGLHYAGGLIGFCTGETLIMSKCSFDGTLIQSAPTSTNYITGGGLVGRCQRASSIGSFSAENCSVQGSITINTSSRNAYVGAYLGMRMNELVSTFTSCDKSGISLSLNDTPKDNIIGNQ